MFIRKKSGPDPLDQAIGSTLAMMGGMNPLSKEYVALMAQLVQLYKLKENDSSKRVSQDTLIIVAGNLLGIVLILHYEKINVVTTKALGFVMKLR